MRQKLRHGFLLGESLAKFLLETGSLLEMSSLPETQVTASLRS
jgi:hypothetical protein